MWLAAKPSSPLQSPSRRPSKSSTPKMLLATAFALLTLASTASAQTWSKCNPLQGAECPPNQALGMSVNIDFTKGSVNSFAASGSPSYSDDDGVAFTVTQSGDAPQLAALFYIMFGRVELTMKAAPGAGIVSSLVLESDDLDEVDIEWLGSNPDEMQSNYFGKGKVTTYNRGQFHKVQGTQADFIKYTIDWTKDRIVWMAGDTVLRTLEAGDAEQDQYPQTPMQVKFGSWAGGDPATNEPGTVDWARGPTDYSKGPFSMYVRSVVITDYSTGSKYEYGDDSGSWESIKAIDGDVNGNFGKHNDVAASATATGSGPAPTVDVSVPVGGIAKDGSSATATQTGWPWVAGANPTGGTIPSGWHMNSEGKIMRSAAPGGKLSALPPAAAAVVLGPVLGAFLFSARLW